MAEKIRMGATDSFYADDVKHVAGGTEYEVDTEARAAERERAGDVRVTKAASPAPARTKRGRRGSG